MEFSVQPLSAGEMIGQLWLVLRNLRLQMSDAGSADHPSPARTCALIHLTSRACPFSLAMSRGVCPSCCLWVSLAMHVGVTAALVLVCLQFRPKPKTVMFTTAVALAASYGILFLPSLGTNLLFGDVAQ